MASLPSLSWHTASTQEKSFSEYGWKPHAANGHTAVDQILVLRGEWKEGKRERVDGKKNCQTATVMHVDIFLCILDSNQWCIVLKSYKGFNLKKRNLDKKPRYFWISVTVKKTWGENDSQCSPLQCLCCQYPRPNTLMLFFKCLHYVPLKSQSLFKFSRYDLVSIC